MTIRPSRRRTRRLGVLGLALASFLSPAGKIIATAVAAAVLVGGIATQFRSPARSVTQANSSPSTVPTHFSQARPVTTVLTHIESKDGEIPIMLVENMADYSGIEGPYALLGGLAGGEVSGPGSNPPRGTPHGAPYSTPPGTGTPPLNISQPGGNPIAGNPAGPTHFPPSPPGPAQGTSPTHPPSGAGPSAIAPPNSGSPNKPPSGTPPVPTQVAGPVIPEGNVPDNTPDETTKPSGRPHNSGPADAVSGPSSEPGSLPPSGTGGRFLPVRTFDSQRTEPDGNQAQPQTIQPNAVAVPEPSMIGLILLGVAAMAWTGRRRSASSRRT